MKTLVLNCGSSSLKFQLIIPETNTLIAKGMVERIGASDAIFSYKPTGKNPVKKILEVANHEIALRMILNTLTDKSNGVISIVTEIDAVGHRVVHGGEKFSASVLITPEVIESIQECAIFAPLHNPANLMGIQACSELIENIDQVAVFDTAFHQQIPPKAYLYGLPMDVYDKYKIRRYGFHGTSHAYVSKQAAQILDRDYTDFKVITCHLGNGASITAIKNGISVDTSMGFTPLEGLVMGTRCGDIDPAIIPYLMEKENLSAREIDNLLNKASGMKGLTRITNDMREIEDEAIKGTPVHKLALDIYMYRIKKYIGSYFAVLNGADALVFTAGVGENSPIVRQTICEELSNFGIAINSKKNDTNEVLISSGGKVAVLVVPTNEELAIAQETYAVLSKKYVPQS